MKRPRILDLFCGAGGCGAGYAAAGFDVVGVDLAAQPRYPFPFIRANALDVMTRFMLGGLGATAIDTAGRHWSREDFQAIHASPPCQSFSVTRHLPNANRSAHVDLVPSTRSLLEESGLPWVIENVVGAPLSPWAVSLCGLMFGLTLFRHRLFESSFFMLAPSHPKHGRRRIGVDGFVCVAGHGGQATGWAGSGTRRTVPADHRDVAAWRRAMGIDWMTRDELAQAIPPAYTTYIGRQLITLT